MLFKEMPFYQSKKFSIALALNCSLFIYLFLVFFQPFGVNNYRMHSVISLELILGILPIIPVVFFTIFFSERYLRPVFREKLNSSRLGWYALEFFLIGSFSFLLYNVLGNFHDFNLKSYLLHILEVSSVLIFPFAGTLFYFRYKNLEREYDQVMSVSNQQSSMDKMLMLKGDYKKDEIGLKPKDIVYMLTEDNYVGLNYLDGEILRTYLIRSTLSKMEQSLNSEYFIRCHRSYLINLKQVESYQKKQGRISIKLHRCDDLIPVSRSAEKALLDKLGEVK